MYAVPKEVGSLSNLKELNVKLCKHLAELPPEVEAQWRSGEYAETARARAQRAAQKPET